ncbi:MAG: PAS domain S-box protein [Cryomorphaceae bacterium]|nr:PAS domain S-box protein [Flavobacteriales bacterium]
MDKIKPIANKAISSLSKKIDEIQSPACIVNPEFKKLVYANALYEKEFGSVKDYDATVLHTLQSKGVDSFDNFEISVETLGEERYYQALVNSEESAGFVLVFIKMAYRESEKIKFEELLENASDLIQELNSDGEIVYINKSWIKTLGFSREEVFEKPFVDFIETVEKQAYQHYFEQVKQGSKLPPRIWTLRSKDGRKIIVETNDDIRKINGKAHSVRCVMRNVSAAIDAELRFQEQAAKMEAIFQSSSIMFWTVNEETKLTSFNQTYSDAIYSQYGKYPEINLNRDKPKDLFAPKTYHDFWNEKYAEVFETGKSISFQTTSSLKNGKVVYRDIYLNPIKGPGSENKIREVAGIALDITDKYIAEQKILDQNAKIQSIFNSTSHMIWSMDRNSTFVSFNDAMIEKVKVRFDINLKVGMDVVSFTDKCGLDISDKWNSVMKKLLDGEKMSSEISLFDRDGNKHIEDVSLTPIRNNKGKVVEIAGFSQTVTYRKKAEQKLKNQAAKISAIFDSTAMYIWTLDRKFRLVSFNKVFADQYYRYFERDVSIGSNFLGVLKEFSKEKAYENLKEIFKAVLRGKSQQFEGVIYTRKGEKVWLENHYTPVYTDNRITEISCVSYEITERKLIDEQMHESIREKEILLQEVHHRVKNNLQVISSILNLQSAYVKDSNSLNILRESQNRIKSMSFIHESLYQTRDFSHIEFSDYMLSLTNNLVHSYSLQTANISLRKDMEKVFLELDQAIPCGLIANEIVSNSLKYAFPGDTKGEIYIGIKEVNNTIELVIADNGVGLPEELDYENSESLGLQLVYTLAEQLNASISVTIENGTKYLITFEKQ